MTREEFASLPTMIALGLIYDVASSRLRDLPMPEVPKPPLYDGRLGRQGGFVWMSEMQLRDLEWWHSKKQGSAEGGGQYAEKDGKTAATLAKWIAWRRLYPEAAWSGKRGDERATGRPPSGSPVLNQWPERGEGKGPKKPSSGATSGPSPDNDGREEERSYDF